MTTTQTSLNDAVRSYYNTRSESFFDLWGGEYIHYGIYRTGDESLAQASRTTVDQMYDALQLGGTPARVIDLGSGFGSAARVFAEHGHRVSCVDLSAQNNAVHRRLNREQGIDGIAILERSFESLPFDDRSFEVAWSQEAICHSEDPVEVFKEVFRVLAPGGQFTLSNTCCSVSIPRDGLAKLERRNPVHLKSVDEHTRIATALGFELVSCRDLSDSLTLHYRKMLANARDKRDGFIASEGEDYYERVIKGLSYWLQTCERGHLAWAIWHFVKPA